LEPLLRTLHISTDVFAAIWSARKDGEQTEDAILRRILKVAPGTKTERDLHVTVGFHDPRFGVKLEPGFEIFRTYLGKEYRAQAIQGFWVLSSTGMGYPSLNELSNAIGAKKENAWGAWFYLENGKRKPISDLRDPSKIVHRN
jgi:hypothetical protein